MTADLVTVGPDGNFTIMSFGPVAVFIESTLYYGGAVAVVITLPVYFIVISVQMMDVRRKTETSGSFYRICMVSEAFQAFESFFIIFFRYKLVFF